MMRLNNKGYMLVEIIVAAVLAFSVAFYLINLTYKFNNQNMDIYNYSDILNDKINITKNIMDDLDGFSCSTISCDTTGVKFSECDNGEDRRLVVDTTNNKLTYSKDNGYTVIYTKSLDSGNEFTGVSCGTNANSVKIGITNIYQEKEYNINLVW